MENKQPTIDFKAMGTTKTEVVKMVRRYDTIHGEGAYQFYIDFGEFAAKCKEHLANIKNNPNTGLFSDMIKAHFPNLDSNIISNSQWLYRNQVEVTKWRKDNRKTVSNPNNIKTAIRKFLKDEGLDTDKDALDRFEFKAPKGASAKKVEGDQHPVDNPNPEITLDECLDNMERVFNGLEKKRNWTLERFKRFEALLIKYSNFYEDKQDSLAEKKLIKINDDVMKKKTA